MVHAVYIPELEIDIPSEAQRLSLIMKKNGVVNVFISEGAGADTIADTMRAQGKTIPVDAFGHMKLDAVNVGQWFGEQLAKLMQADKALVQKSGYYARAARANKEDIVLIKTCSDQAVRSALRGESGVVGHDEDRNGVLRTIEFNRIKGGKPFNVEKERWFGQLLKDIGQPMGKKVVAKAERGAHAVPANPPPSKL